MIYKRKISLLVVSFLITSILNPLSVQAKVQNRTVDSVLGMTKATMYQSTITDLPTTYNDDYQSLDCVTAVKDQDHLDCCWAYAANSMLESAIMKQYSSEEIFSENHMRYALSYGSDNIYGFDRFCYDTGNISMAIAYWSRGVSGFSGPVLESNDTSDVEFSERSTDITSAIPASNYYVDRIIEVDDITSNSEKSDYLQKLKSMILDYGAVHIGYYSTDSCYSGDETDYNYYTSDTTDQNHSVVLVGWNDSYPASNFSTDNQPSSDGAFLVKNCYGTDWGMGGYFWISYETPIYGACAIADVIEDRSEIFDHIYEYDEFGKMGCSGSTWPEVYYANNYTLESSNEMLTAVSTYCVSPDSYFNVYVDTDTSDDTGAIEVDITNMDKSSEGYYVADEGYITFQLETPIQLSSEYQVAVRVYDGANTKKVPVEANIDDYSSNAVIEQNVGSTSCISLDRLETFNTYSICLKAFTKDIKSPSVELSDDSTLEVSYESYDTEDAMNNDSISLNILETGYPKVTANDFEIRDSVSSTSKSAGFSITSISCGEVGSQNISIDVSKSVAAGSYSLFCCDSYLGEITVIPQIIEHSMFAYSAITFSQDGSVGNMEYNTADEVISQLPDRIDVILNNAHITSIPITWEDTDGYDPNTDGSYTFTASWGTLPEGVNNLINIKAPSVEVLVPLDNIPPTITSATILDDTVSANSATVQLETDDNSTYYMLTSDDSSDITKDMILSSNTTVSGDIAANTLTHIYLQGLEANTAYTVYLIAEDEYGNFSPVTSFTFTTKQYAIDFDSDNSPNATGTYGTSVKDLTICGGTAFCEENGDTNITGSWSWKESYVDLATVNGTTTYIVVFTPDDDRYQTVEQTIIPVIEKGIPECTAPTDLKGYRYKKLSSVILPDCFMWECDADTTILNKTATYYVTYNPDPENYIDLTGIEVTVTVTKKSSSSSSSGGGGGGSSSGSSSSSSDTSSTTTTNDDIILDNDVTTDADITSNNSEQSDSNDSPTADITKVNLSDVISEFDDITNNTKLSSLPIEGSYILVSDFTTEVKANITLSDCFTSGQTVYVYHVSESNLLEEAKNIEYTVSSDHTIVVDILQDGYYVILSEKADNDIILALSKQVTANTKKKSVKVGKNIKFNISLPVTLEQVTNLTIATSSDYIGGVTITYKTSNKKVASVNKKGVIKTKNPGTAVIKAKITFYNGTVATFRKKIVVK